ncbi:hypothetical protein [Aeromonas sobria]|uniref:hypothetical protein n=1 Tax=Aeromonas sobria TaxID=646 RepID=UPI003D06112D
MVNGTGVDGMRCLIAAPLNRESRSREPGATMAADPSHRNRDAMNKYQVFATLAAPDAFTLLDMAGADFFTEKQTLLAQGLEVMGEPILAPDARTAAHTYQDYLINPSLPYGAPAARGTLAYLLLHAPRLFGKR